MTTLNYVTLTFTEQDAGNDPGSGLISIQPTAAVVAAGIAVVSQQAVTRSLATGSASVTLVACDQAGTTPAAGFWAYQITMPGATPQLYLINYANGATQRFDSLTPVVAETTYGAAAGTSSGFTNPMTTLGDLIYENATPAAARLAGDTSNTRKFLRTQASGGVAQAPAWDTIAAGDLPAATATTQGAVTLKPWQFPPEASGAKGDGKAVSDAAISASSNTVACTTSTPFTSTLIDAGKIVYIPGAGAGGADLLTTISTVTDSGHAVLAAAAGTTVSARGMVFGSDDAAAVNAAKTAAVAYAQAHNQYAEVVLRPVMYIIAGAPVIGGATAGNAQIPLPVIPMTSAKVTLVFKGLTSDAAALPHWQQAVIQAAGPVLACLSLDGTNNGTNGPASVIGGPYNGYGFGSSGNTWSNMQVVLDGLNIAVPFNSTYCGWDFWGVGEAYVPSSSVMAMGIVPSGGAWPQMSFGAITNQWTFGGRMPSTDNNDRCDIGYFSCEGLCYGLMPSEHTTALSVRAINCIIGIEAYAGGTLMPHALRILYVSAEDCVAGLGFFDHTVHCDIDTLDIENCTNAVYDANNNGQGTIGLRGDAPGNGYSLTGIVNGGTGLKLVNLSLTPGPVASPQAPPTSGAAWLNGYYRDAWITLHATTITAVSIDSTAQNGLQSSPATYSFFLPGGHSYTPTYTGTLTHTVTLL